MSLRTIWFGFNKHLGIPEEFISRWWAIVEARYSETQRHYHTLAHIEDMFHKFEIVKGKLRSPESVSLAIFFHDIIYEPTKRDNEEQSAELFQQYSQESSIDQNLTDVVVDWIIATKKHQTPEHLTSGAYGQTDLHYFLDMDMAVLGRPNSEYTTYVEQIEMEYNHMSKEAFNSGRTTVMKNFLKVPNIFATKEFRDLYEHQARQNIENEISVREAVMQNTGQTT